MTRQFRLLLCSLALGGCVGSLHAYAFRPDADIAVVNRCRSDDGFEEAVGKAWAVKGTGNSQLKVSFFWPFRSDYWILGLDDGYQWAVVGNPNRKYLWVLSRTPQMLRGSRPGPIRTSVREVGA